MLRWMVGVRRYIGPETDDSTDEDSNEASNLEEQAADEHEDAFAEGNESWSDWIRRATHIAEEHLARAGIDDWVVCQRRQKYKWAGHVARRNDGRWSHKTLLWTPEGGKRSVGRPRRRWIDGISTAFATEEIDWYFIAQDRQTWAQYEDNFVKARQ